MNDTVATELAYQLGVALCKATGVSDAVGENAQSIGILLCVTVTADDKAYFKAMTMSEFAALVSEVLTLSTHA